MYDGVALLAWMVPVAATGANMSGEAITIFGYSGYCTLLHVIYLHTSSPTSDLGSNQGFLCASFVLHLTCSRVIQKGESEGKISLEQAGIKG